MSGRSYHPNPTPASVAQQVRQGERLLHIAGQTDPSDVLRASGLLASTRRDGSIVLVAPSGDVLALSKGTTVVRLQGTLEAAARALLDAITKPVFAGHRQREAFAPLRPPAERKKVVVGGNTPPDEMESTSLDMGWPE